MLYRWRRWKWLGFRRETSRECIKWEWGGAIWLHDKRAEGKARRIIAALHLGVYTAAVGYEINAANEEGPKMENSPRILAREALAMSQTATPAEFRVLVREKLPALGLALRTALDECDALRVENDALRAKLDPTAHQRTECARCHKIKFTPWREDDEGYICAGCLAAERDALRIECKRLRAEIGQKAS